MVEGVNIHFYHTLTKVTFTFKKVAPVPNEVTIEKIEFQNVGKSGNLAMTEIPTTTTKNGKPKFVWSDVAIREGRLLLPPVTKRLLKMPP